MSFTRLVVSATFTGGLIALSLQAGGIAQAAPSPAFLIADSSSSSSQGEQRDSRKGMRDAESSGKMQGDKDAANTADSNKMGGQSSQSSQPSDSNKRGQSGTGGGNMQKNSDSLADGGSTDSRSKGKE